MNETSRGQLQFEPSAETGQTASVAKRQVILVLGMHRSGTSAVAGVINALGVAGPTTMMPPTEANPRGYFESARLFNVLDKLLASAGSAWHDWRQFDLQWLNSAAAEQHRQNIRSQLIEDFGDERLVYIKDPRICRLVPLMQSILAELNFSPVAILPVRNPLEVAYSLQRRDGFALSKSLLLWLRHVLDAEFHSRHMPRCILAYEEFLLDWRYDIKRAAEQTGIVWPDRSEGSDLEIEQFLTPELHRERVSFDRFNDHPEVTPWVRETYSILSTVAADGESKPLLDRLDLVRSKFDEACRIFGPALAAAELARPTTASLRSATNSPPSATG